MDPTNPIRETAPQGAAATPTPPEAAASASGEQPQASEHQLNLWEKLTAGADRERPSAESGAPITLEPGNGQPGDPAPAVEEKPAPKPKQARAIADLAEKEARAAQLAAEAEASAVELAQLRALKQELAENPLAALEKNGVSYERVTLDALKGKKVAPADPEIQKLRTELAQQVEQLKEAYRQDQIQTFKTNLNGFLNQNAEKYELITAHGLQAAVWNRIESEAQRTKGKLVPTYEQAADWLEQQLEKASEASMSTKKMREKFGAALAAKAEASPSAPAAPAAKSAPPPQKPTLTNKIGTPMTPAPPAKPKTKDDAFAVFREGVLKAWRGETLR